MKRVSLVGGPGDGMVTLVQDHQECFLWFDAEGAQAYWSDPAAPNVFRHDFGFDPLGDA